MRTFRQALIIVAALWFGAVIGAQLAHKERAGRDLAYQQQIGELEDTVIELQYELSETH